MNLSPEIIAEVLQVFRQTRSPFKTSDKTGVPIKKVFDLIEANKEQLAAARERHGGEGRPELRAFIVARRKVTQLGWDNKAQVIAQAREDFEAGTHLLATGRDGGWLILYSIPRQGKPEPKPDYFLPEVA